MPERMSARAMAARRVVQRGHGTQPQGQRPDDHRHPPPPDAGCRLAGYIQGIAVDEAPESGPGRSLPAWHSHRAASRLSQTRLPWLAHGKLLTHRIHAVNSGSR